MKSQRKMYAYTSAVTRFTCFNSFLKNAVQDEQYFFVLCKKNANNFSYWNYLCKYVENKTYDNAAIAGKQLVFSCSVEITFTNLSSSSSSESRFVLASFNDNSPCFTTILLTLRKNKRKHQIKLIKLKTKTPLTRDLQQVYLHEISYPRLNHRHHWIAKCPFASVQIYLRFQINNFYLIFS